MDSRWLPLLLVGAVAAAPVANHVERLDDDRLFFRGDIYVKVAPLTPADACANDLYLVYSCNPTKYILSVLCVVGLVVLAGAMSGLTVGVLSLNRTHLAVLEQEGVPRQKAAAARLLPILRNHRLLLVTLVLMNALANEALPMFLNTLINPIASVVFSVTFVVLFGEIVPTALCTGERQLVIGAACVPLLQFLMRLTYPITYPIAVFLNFTVGHSAADAPYSHNELKALVAIQADPTAGLSTTEVDLLQGILELGAHDAASVMTPVTTASDVSPEPCVPSTSRRLELPAVDDSCPDWHDHDIYVHHSTIYVVDRIFNQVTRLHKCVTTPASTPLAELYALLQDQLVVALIANDQGEVVGLVTWRDVLRATKQPVQKGEALLNVDTLPDDDASCSSTDSSTSPDGHVPKRFFSREDDIKYTRLCILGGDDEDEFGNQHRPVACS
ncbi:hypothetical protein SPRG_19848 [Saprolegnia parasitica CBS 223.65]|uniref:CNNM transmembrane domain-containing protein n=1 Tax=Saprolegnia parasitica (strain CBS 223.65) TaxID=695850 RepID=A0A067CHU9_SAPPC|nr:hypothetical protein SPRG_19848 [Saprolegnia parasitica CBS 223.65]KDO30309.1 hypothetical protein SPRG_19848 [Saprolegnia parasitica CBS 223.65]|eukprot:XP_012199092.1 hypothetical protein SPRG_19848 [Saprolegnia parasitica CBS 223.65]